MRTGMGGGSNNIKQLREAVARLRWVLNATAKDFILVSRVGLQKGDAISSQKGGLAHALAYSHANVLLM